MKKYYMSFVDFSEIVNVTADEAQLEKARERMTELGLLTEKGNPSSTQISSMTASVSAPFFDKLKRRINRRPGGITAVKDTVKKLCDKKEYTALFLYLCFLYGFMEWQVPERVLLLPAAPDALKLFASEFLAEFERYLANAGKESEDTAEHDDSEPENM